jgi:hypothetical protein
VMVNFNINLCLVPAIPDKQSSIYITSTPIASPSSLKSPSNVNHHMVNIAPDAGDLDVTFLPNSSKANRAMLSIYPNMSSTCVVESSILPESY